MVATVILVGVAGFGRIHLNNQRRLHEAGRTRLTAFVDPAVRKLLATGDADVPRDAPMFDTLSEAMASVGVPDIVIVSTPIHLHAPIAKEALEAGADVYLEKPPFACMDDFDELLKVQQATGRAVQVGFQSLGSEALAAFDSDAMNIGKIKSVRAMGLWLRKQAYWNRSQWVGKRSMGNVWVMDGVATNALSHAVITALRIAGANTVDEVDKVEVEAFRSNPIDSDDTTSIRVQLKNGLIVTAGLTLCATVQIPPVVEVVGELGTAVFEYTTDDVQVTLSPGQAKKFGRRDLTDNLLDHREKGTPLMASLVSTGAYMRVLEAIRLSGEPTHVEKRWIHPVGEGEEWAPILQDVEGWIRKAADKDALLSTVGCPWAFSQRDAQILEAKLGPKTVFRIQDGAGTTPSSSPRPYLHPITTLSGIEVTATRPSDHDWHLGSSFAVPDVDGISYWGGGTYVHGKGYVLLDNWGRQVTKSLDASSSSLDHILEWRDPKDVLRIQEHRHIEWASLESGWQMLFRSSLTAVDRAASLGSPGTNGRVNAGYGGFNWRLPRCSNVKILSPDAEGEDAVHGSHSAWIAWSARFQGKPGACGDATLVMIAEDATTAKDPWIVREKAYPGLGSGVAWDKRVEIPAGQTITRGFRIAIMDGLMGVEACAAAADAMRKTA